MHNSRKFWVILKRLLIYSIKWKKTIILAFTMLLSASIAEVLGPILVSKFINNFIIQEKFEIISIIFMILTFISLHILSSILHYFQTFFFNKTAISIIKKLRIDIINSILKQPMKKFDTQPIGKIISRITNDTEVIKDLYHTVIATFFKSITLILTILTAMFSIDWRMAIITSVIFPIVFLIMIVYQYYSKPLLINVRTYIANINDKFNETITGMHIIQQFNEEKKYGKYIKKISKEHYLAKMNILKLDGCLLRPLINLISTLILCGIIILFVFFSKNTIEVGILYAFISYLNKLNEPLIAIATQQGLLQQSIVAGERIFKLIDSPKQKYGNYNQPLKSGKIKIKKLNFSYEKKKQIIKNLNITIPTKNFFAFIGPTGSGKSTLANLLMGYYKINTGEIFLDKHILSSLSHKVIKHGLSIINEEPIILTDKILTNITLGRKIPKKKIWKILKKIELSKFIKSLPKGLKTKVLEKGNNISSGQKQLISLARVLITKPKILILDEITANLDSETEKKIQKTLLSIKKNTTLIVISNRLSIISKADKIIVLKKGKIIESGNHKELLKKKKEYWNIYKIQRKL